jgi:hypothetical protein
MKRKILYAIDTLQIGGAERSILDIATHLDDVEPVVCFLYRKDCLRSQFESRNIRVISAGLSGPYQFIEGIRRFRHILRREKPDLVVATLLRTELITRVACRLEGTPNIGTFVNDTYSPHLFAVTPLSLRLKVRFFQFWNMLTARLCTSDAGKKFIILLMSESRHETTKPRKTQKTCRAHSLKA